MSLKVVYSFLIRKYLAHARPGLRALGAAGFFPRVKHQLNLPTRATIDDMASVGTVTRQIAALEISKPSTTNNNSNSGGGTARPLTNIKQPQSNVAKLLTKYAAPNPSLRNPLNGATSSATSTQSRAIQPSQSHSALPSTHPVLDIGSYDGGLELENEKRGEKVFGEAAQDLALDSSIAQ